MKKILALWAVPRSASTAFERMMRERGDHLVHDEPFGKSFYYSEERRDTKRYPDITPDPTLNFDVVLERLKNERKDQPVFIKDLSYQVAPAVNDQFLSHFENSFLVRHPRKVLPSLHNHWPDFTLEETGFGNLLKIFEAVKEKTGKTPPLMDSDDLLRKPEATVKAYCDATGIPFLPEALQWKPEVQAEINQWEGGWHQHTHSSQGFKERKSNNYARIEDNEHLQKAYEYCLPIYQELHEQRLKIH